MSVPIQLAEKVAMRRLICIRARIYSCRKLLKINWALAPAGPWRARKRFPPQAVLTFKSSASVQWLAGSFKDLGDGAVANSIDDETFLIEAVLAEEQLCEPIAIYVHRIDQLQPGGHIET
jgi:hypothetical protein